MFAALGVASALLISAAPALAQTGGTEFGKRDEFVLSLERLLGFQSQEINQTSIDGFGFHPYLWGTVGLHSVQSSGLSLGALLGASYFRIPNPDGEDQSSTFLQLRPRIGYAGWLQKSLGYWVRIGPSLVTVLDHDEGETHYSFGVGGEAYVVIRLHEHVALLAGIHVDPSIVGDEVDRGDETEETSFSTKGLTIGLMGEFF